MVGEDTQSSSGASGLGGRGRAARVGDRHARSSCSSLRLTSNRAAAGLAARARLYLKMILGIHRSHVY